MHVSRTSQTGSELVKHEESQALYVLFLLCIHLAISRPFIAWVLQGLKLGPTLLAFRIVSTRLENERCFVISGLSFSLCFGFCY